MNHRQISILNVAQTRLSPAKPRITGRDYADKDWLHTLRRLLFGARPMATKQPEIEIRPYHAYRDEDLFREEYPHPYIIHTDKSGLACCLLIVLWGLL